MTKQCRLELADEAATLALGARLAAISPPHGVIFLEGELGAGKTTLVRGWLRGLGFEGRVKSPTYTLVEPYVCHGRQVFHFDLYRLADPEELEYIGARDYFSGQGLCLIEWPGKGWGELPPADVVIRLTVQGEGRRAELLAVSSLGERFLQALSSG